MNGDAEDQANKAYTISIPGMSDVFILPIQSLDNPQLKLQRILRMKAKHSPIPDKLKWIPQAINYLDDAQDELAMALIVGKFLLRYVAPRFIPYLGWALLANDILNLGTGLLSLAMTARPGKLGLREVITSLGFTKAKRMKRVAQFMGKTNWVGAALTAGQVLENRTGYGLRLGGIMGCASDIVWGGIRSAQGKQVRFQGPPPADPISKAARFIMQSAQMSWLLNSVTPEDKQLIIAAQAVAASTLVDTTDLTQLDNKASILENTEYPVFEPWDESSRWALQQEGIDPGGVIRPMYRYVSDKPSFLKVIQDASSAEYQDELTSRSQFGATDTGTIMMALHEQSGRDLLAGAVGGFDGIEEYYDEELNLIQAMTEYMLFPPYKPTNVQMNTFIKDVAIWMRLNNIRFISASEIKKQLTMRFGGWSNTSPWL